tara:strand:- start:2193 stop:2567 length:375 start_codon:yes stop_codon:yes gene_type:complete
MSKIPHIKITETMLNKYIIDAKVDVLKDFRVTEFPQTVEVGVFIEGFRDKWGKTTIRFYKTKRGDKRMSIKNLKQYAKVGDYVWFPEIVKTSEGGWEASMSVQIGEPKVGNLVMGTETDIVEVA